MTLKEAKELIENNIQADIEILSPKDRLTFYLGLMEYFNPKLNRVGYETEDILNEIKIINAVKSDKSI